MSQRQGAPARNETVFRVVGKHGKTAQTHLHTRDDGKNLESWKLDVGKCKLETAKAQRQSWCKVETLRLGNRQNILPKTKNPTAGSYALQYGATRARATETVRENRILFTILLNDRVNCILSYYSGWRRSGPPRAPCCLAGPDSRSSNRGRCIGLSKDKSQPAGDLVVRSDFATESGTAHSPCNRRQSTAARQGSRVGRSWTHCRLLGTAPQRHVVVQPQSWKTARPCSPMRATLEPNLRGTRGVRIYNAAGESATLPRRPLLLSGRGIRGQEE
jgi:hypothetical protein